MCVIEHLSYVENRLSTANHKFDPSSPDDGRWTIDDAPPSIVYRRSSKAGTHLRFDALSSSFVQKRRVELLAACTKAYPEVILNAPDRGV
jgi:hypothetical protein